MATAFQPMSSPSPAPAASLLADAPRKTLSCVVPAYNEAGNLPQLLPWLHGVLAGTGMPFEILVINDGSRDATREVLQQLCAEVGQVRALHFSRNFGKEAALTAGLDAAQGDAVLLMDADLQHSPDLIPQMIQHWRDGAEVVYAVRQSREDETALKQFGARLFYKAVNRGTRFEMPPDAGDFRLMDRKVVLALRRLPERNRFMKGLYAWAGFRTVAIPYQPLSRESGLSRYNIIKLLHFAIDGMTAFTTWPLRVVTVMGLLSALVAFLYGGWVVLEYFMWGNKVSGWSTLIVVILLFFGMQMVFTGVLGEYIGRIFEEVKRRPVYLVAEENGRGLPCRPAPGGAEVTAGANIAQAGVPAALPDDVPWQ